MTPSPTRCSIASIRKGIFVGANDGGSGVAILMELGHEMPTRKTAYGVDFLFIDGEEFIFDENGEYFLGSGISPGNTSRIPQNIVIAGVSCWTWSATPISSFTRSGTAFRGAIPGRWSRKSGPRPGDWECGIRAATALLDSRRPPDAP